MSNPQQVSAGIFSALAILALLWVPYRMPDSGRMVFGWLWQPAQYTFLLRGDVFTQNVISNWIWYKREREVDAIRLRPHPYEYHTCTSTSEDAPTISAGSA